MTKKERNQPTAFEPPCATCERLFDFNPCSFAAGGKPPEGAEYDIDTSKGYEGYTISSCPEYEPEKSRSTEELDTDGCVNLLAAVVKQAMADYAAYQREVKTARIQAAAWARKSNLLHSSIEQIEKFVPERGRPQLRRIRELAAEKETDYDALEKLTDDSFAAVLERAERAEIINSLSLNRLKELEKFNRVLLRTLKNGRTLCDICREKNTMAEMGCNNRCRECDDKCICGKCVRFDKFEFGGGK